MTTSVLGRVPLEEISEQARQVRFTVVLATVILGVFVLAGRLAGFAWVAAVSCCLAARYGFRQAAGAPAAAAGEPRPQGSKL